MSYGILGQEAEETDFYLDKMNTEKSEATKEIFEKYRLIAEYATDVISIIDSDSFCYTYVSPSYEKIVGYDGKEMLGKYCLEIVHPDDRAAVIETLIKGIANGAGMAQYRIQTKDGSSIWVETNGKLIDAENKSSGVLFISRDISERKRVEDTLRDKLHYLNTLIDTMNEICCTIDRDYKITFANQRTVAVTGYSLEEEIGRSILDFLPAKDREQFSQEIEQHLKNGGTNSHEHSFICKDGRELLLREKSSLIIENGEITGILGLAEDITQQRRIEKEMARLDQMNMIAGIAASIAHEIRNPMTTVKGFLQMMRQKDYMQEDRANIDLMLEELGRANFIITEFLSLAKNKVIDLFPQKLNRIVESMAPLLEADAVKEDKKIQLRLDNISDLLLDEKEIRQLILNLVRNGLEAMPVGGTVTIRTEQSANGVVLSVKDEGAGIAPEIRKQLGTPFLSTKENGIGLGLAVCYSIAERHNANMDYETGAQGTIFRVKFTSNI